MSSSARTKQPLSERSSNIPSPIKSPSKIALPPSPVTSPTKTAKQSFTQATADDPRNPIFEPRASTTIISQKPTLIRKVSEAYSSGQTYVSPSDDILSPTTRKLSEVKGRRFGNYKQSSSLYDSHNLFGKLLKKPHFDQERRDTKP